MSSCESGSAENYYAERIENVCITFSAGSTHCAGNGIVSKENRNIYLEKNMGWCVNN